jgi:hypothetical protein
MSVGKVFRKGLPFSNVVAAGVATANITPGRTIERIVLELGGTAFTKAMLTLVELKANGRTFFKGSASQIDKVNKYRGITDDAAYLTLDFTEIKGRDKLDQLVGGFDTSKGISNITIECTIAGATAPTLAMYVVESGAQQGDYSPLMSKLLRYSFNTSVGGQILVPLPFSDRGAAIKRIHFDCAGGLMTDLEVKENSLTIFEASSAVNEFIQGEHGRVPQTDWFTADFIVDGNQGNCWDTRNAKSIEVLPTFSAAESGYILVEYYDILNNL